MYDDPAFGTTDADFAALAEIVADVESVSDAVRRAQVAEVRVLARAGALAQKQAEGADARTQAHDMALRSIAAEIAGAVRSTDRTLQRRIGDAREPVECYPSTLSAWERGDITRGHVYVIVQHGTDVPIDRRPEYEAAAIDICRDETPNRASGAIEMIAQRIHPRSFTERHIEAAAGRGVRLLSGSNGMSELVATLPTVLADGIHDRLTQQARTIIDDRPRGDTDDDRGIDQVRADILADTLLTDAPSIDPTAHTGASGLGAIRARVQVVVNATTLSGEDDDAADLVGRPPIDADSVRALAADAATWERLLTNPVTGAVLAVDAYRPTSEMRRLLRGRDQRCRFPGCRQPAIRCEIDHTVDAALGGPTACCNLAHLCQRHHSMKQFTPWRVRQLRGGVLEWTSPLGRIYREDAPTPTVWFAPAATPPEIQPKLDPAPF